MGSRTGHRALSGGAGDGLRHQVHLRVRQRSVIISRRDINQRNKMTKKSSPASAPRSQKMDQKDYVALAAFRRSLRIFLAFSEQAARAAGLTPQQHQAI